MQLSDVIYGTTFLRLSNNQKYVLTQDFDNKRQRLCVNSQNGAFEWIPESEEVQIVPVYVLDESNNIIPLKEDGNYDLGQDTNIP